MSGTLRADAKLRWAASDELVHVHEIVIMTSGWLRVTWLDGLVTHVSPAAVKTVAGKGVSYGD